MKNSKLIATLVVASSLVMNSTSYNSNEPNHIINKNTYEITLDRNINHNGYMVCDSPIYKDIETFTVINYIDKYQKVYIIGTYQDYCQVKFFKEENQLITGFIPISTISLLPETFVEVDLSSQQINMYQDNNKTLSSKTVTGKPNVSPTRLGYFEIYYKEKNATLRGSNSDGSTYASFVDYWMPFDGGIGLHDAEYHTCSNGSHGWRNTDSFGGHTYEYSGSHGCVNLTNETAKYIYDNSEVGTKVLVHK